MTMAVLNADSAREASCQVRARKRAAHYHLLAEQRRFELRVDAEVRRTIQTIFEERCVQPIEEAIKENQRHVKVDIPTSYLNEREPIRPEFWWKPGVRCKTIVKHLTAYLEQQGFTVREEAPYFNRKPRNAGPAQIGLHAIPLTIYW